MNKIKYPPKPWVDGQREKLLPGIDFMYNLALKNWVPISPGYTSEQQLVDNFGVTTLEELNAKFEEIENIQEKLDSDIERSGRIWKTINIPVNPAPNDLWLDFESGKTFSYVAATGAWIEWNLNGTT